MNKSQAKKIARSGINTLQIKTMLRRAYDDGAANDSRSKANSSFSRAVCFNILWKGYQEEDNREVKNIGDILGATNALREFGEYWDGDVPKQPTRKKPTGDYIHHDAIDINNSLET